MKKIFFAIVLMFLFLTQGTVITQAAPSGFDTVDREEREETEDEEKGEKDDKKENLAERFLQPKTETLVNTEKESGSENYVSLRRDFHNRGVDQMRYDAGRRYDEDGNLYYDYEYMVKGIDYYIDERIEMNNRIMTSLDNSSPVTMIRELVNSEELMESFRKLFGSTGDIVDSVDGDDLPDFDDEDEGVE